MATSTIWSSTPGLPQLGLGRGIRGRHGVGSILNPHSSHSFFAFTVSSASSVSHNLSLYFPSNSAFSGSFFHLNFLANSAGV